jgi:general stress protein 26
MTAYLPLSFVEEKVRDLENALFFSTSDSVLKMPTCVVKVLQTDEFGQLWFVVPKPTQFIHTFDKTFPAKLDFFRKGCDFYLKILGKAFIVNDPEDINSIWGLNERIKQKARKNELVIMKVKITHADYTEKNPAKVSARLLISQVKIRIHQWFLQAKPKNPEFFSRIPANQSIHSPVYSN